MGAVRSRARQKNTPAQPLTPVGGYNTTGDVAKMEEEKEPVKEEPVKEEKKEKKEHKKEKKDKEEKKEKKEKNKKS